MSTRGRIVAAAGIVAVCLVPQPAAAHVCMTPAEATPGEVGAVNVSVPAEEEIVTGVSIELPRGWRPEPVSSGDVWKGTRTGRVVTFTGGEIRRFTCTTFLLKGTPAAKATYHFPVTVTGENGYRRRYADPDPYSPDAAQVVYAGTTPDDLVGEASDGRGGSNVPVPAIAGVLLAVGAGALVIVRRRRPPAAAAAPRSVPPSAKRRKGR